MKWKIILFGVFLSTFILILPPCIGAINVNIQNEKNSNIKNNAAADLMLWDFKITNVEFRFGALESDVEFTIKNIGNDTYKGKLSYYVETKPIFSNPICYAPGWVSSSKNFTLESGKELVKNVYSATSFGYFRFPYFYWIKVKLEPLGSEINTQNNYLIKLIFLSKLIYP